MNSIYDGMHIQNTFYQIDADAIQKNLDETQKMIKKGRDIEYKLGELQDNWPNLTPEQKKQELNKIGTSPEDVVAFMWRLTQKAEEEGE